ncbi:DUF1631 family protein [Lysobacter capsici]|uniref:DUF1631 family protein n=1 Tax=Lysobacter capsici TaxID=435897 RepID=UPI00287B774C|nr:DUF1631 family protein [Lysobacter capsici]WND81641.1 DUF1631 family protein [Lysobacter capsici]WND86837.1 DUF1631 family protein [Lysobacter capsici]
MSATFDPLDASPRATLATAALPRRVRRLLEQLYALVSDEIAPLLERMLAEYEQQLFRQADQARNPSLQSGYLETLRLVRLRRADLIPRYLLGLETALTRLREGAAVTARPTTSSAPHFRELRLVEDSEVDENTVLRAVASRHESRAGLGLLLLGQRFGVLAGAPAFDSERLPVGPQRLIRSFAEACQPLQISLESRLDLYRVFDQQVMLGYAAMVESMNALLARENVLPSLSFVPLRTRPSAQNPAADGLAALAADPVRRASASDPAGERPNDPARAAGTGLNPGPRTDASAAPVQEPAAKPARANDAPRPHTAWPGQPATAASADAVDFATLQQWLGERRELVDKLRPRAQPSAPATALNTADLLDALNQLKDELPRGPQPLRKVADLRQSLLAAHERNDDNAGTDTERPTALSRDDGDVFDLLDLLYGEIEQRLRGDAMISTLLNRLQAPLLHAALQDRSLLEHSGHPARQLLNTVAEAGARWTPTEEVDPQLHEPLRQAVDHVIEHYKVAPGAFDTANQRLQEHLQSMARKAEVSERRHVEAARGKEKLELAKRRANQAIDASTADQRLPRFVQTLLSQAWADVLTLTLLRHGEDSDAWRRQLAITEQIVAANLTGVGATAPCGLDADIEHALTLVGYHADDAGAISRQLTIGPALTDEAASRTELAVKLRSRVRLGEEGHAPAPRASLSQRDEREQACWEQIRALPFGTWFEFVQNQQGDAVRRRLSWFSPITDNALFVNQRGQRVGEQSLDSLARMLARGQVRIVAEERSRLVDRAWHAALDVLRGFGGGRAPATDGAGA